MKFLSNFKVIILILAANFVLLLSFFVWTYSKSLSNAENLKEQCNSEFLSNTLVNNFLPKYKFVDFDGRSVYENLTQGKVLLVYLRSDCSSCQKEATLLSKHFAEISNRIKIIGVTLEDKSKVELFIKDYNLQFPIIFDKNGDMMLKAKISCTPTNLFIENGIIKKVAVGNFKNAEDIIQSL